MLTTGPKAPKFFFDFAAPRKRVSLSSYFPNGTQYFYAYPAGQASGFLNKVTPDIEELVAARTNSCAGHAVTAVKFAATHHSKIGQDLIDNLAIPQLPDRQLCILPDFIDANLEGEDRNIAIRQALLDQITPGKLIMAQPYTDDELRHLYQIDPSLTTWVNDKNNMEHFISENLLPKRLGTYKSGNEFIADYPNLPLPCVVKVSSSSSGDGVHICHNKHDIARAAKSVHGVQGTILVEQFIKAKKNFGIHFGIPCDRKKPIDLIGVNEQLTTRDGEFIGGIISESVLPKELQPIESYLLNEILPKIRAKGWYGIGCFDVLCDDKDQLFIIDGNFRITGMSAYHLLISSGKVQTPLMSFGGTFHGTKAELEAKLFPLAAKNADHKILQLIALTKYDNTWNINGALFFDDLAQLKERAQLLLDLGVHSQALTQLIHS